MQYWTVGCPVHCCQPTARWCPFFDSGDPVNFFLTLESIHWPYMSLASKWKCSGKKYQRKLLICMHEIKMRLGQDSSLASFPISLNIWHFFLLCYLKKQFTTFPSLILWILSRWMSTFFFFFLLRIRSWPPQILGSSHMLTPVGWFTQVSQWTTRLM